jgi:hypothetical protein
MMGRRRSKTDCSFAHCFFKYLAIQLGLWYMAVAKGIALTLHSSREKCDKL